MAWGGDSHRQACATIVSNSPGRPAGRQTFARFFLDDPGYAQNKRHLELESDQ